MSKGKDDQKNAGVERLEAEKRKVRDEYSRFPFMDWFRHRPKQEPERPPDGTQLEKNDVLAMILAVLSLVMPWVLAMAAALAIVIVVLSLLF